MQVDGSKEQTGTEEMRLCRDRLDAVPEWIWETDSHGVLTYSNRAVEGVLGYAPSDIVGRRVFDLVVPEDQARCQNKFRRSMRGQHHVRNIIGRFRRKDGQIRTLEVSCVPICQGDRAVGLRGISRDVTETLRLRAAVDEALANYKAALDNAPTGIVIIQDERVVYANPKMLELMGYTPEQARSAEVWQFIHPDDRERVSEHYHRRMKGEDVPEQYELRVITKTGEVRYLELRATVITYGGAPAVLDNVVDITERKRAEQALCASEAQYRDLVENISDWVWKADSNLLCIYSSGRVTDMLGYEPDEVLGRPLTDFTPPEEAERVKKAFADAALRREPVNLLDAEFVRKDGLKVTLRSNATPVMAEDGAFLGFRGVSRDVTKLVKAEEALRESETKYRNLVEATGTGYLIVDTQGRVIDANAEYVRLTGRSTLDEIKGRSVLEWTADYDVERNAEEVRKCAETGQARNLEIDYVTPDGRINPIEISANLVETREGPVILTLCRDISERRLVENALKESEERYRLLFERSPDIVIALKDNVIVAVNSAVTRVLGYEVDEVIGLTPWDISPEFQPDGIASREKALQMLDSLRDGTPQVFEWVHRRKDGSPVDCDVSLTAYKVRGEVYVQAIVRDITERKRAEENRRALERQLEAQKRQFYRDTILSVTGGKLDICEAPQIRPFLSRAMLKMDVEEPKEVGRVRREIAAFCRERNLEGERLDSFMIGVGEAITNAIKHASGARVYAGVKNGSLWVGVADRGRGIGSLILPRAVLLRGFSTKPSLGLGYTIMLEVADEVLLKTGDRGTTVILVKQIEEPDLRASPELLPDTWENVPEI